LSHGARAAVLIHFLTLIADIADVKIPIACNLKPGYHLIMKGQRFVYWQDGEFWLGYLEEFPDYMTQGESLEDLKEHLRDLHADLASGQIPAVRRVAELEVS
jgi:hypothetical protein